MDYTEPAVRDNMVGSLRVRIREKVNKVGVAVGVYYGLGNHPARMMTLMYYSIRN